MLFSLEKLNEAKKLALRFLTKTSGNKRSIKEDEVKKSMRQRRSLLENFLFYFLVFLSKFLEQKKSLAKIKFS